MAEDMQHEEPGTTAKDEEVPDMKLADITEGSNERGYPIVKFIDDVGVFAASFTPKASAELLIGAYTDLHTKYKTQEISLINRSQHLSNKVPELEKSLTLVQTLISKREAAEPVISRYALADNIYATAELNLNTDNGGRVNLWLGANVMLEFSYQEALEFLSKNLNKAQRELSDTMADLSFLRDQVVTCEVQMSRIFNWDVRERRKTGKTVGDKTT